MEPTSEMRQAMTMQLNERLNECARNLNDGKLLALLSGGDVVALELKYHWSCLTDLYHRERAHIKAEKQEKIQLSQEKEAFHLVFSELLTYVIEAKKTNSDGPSVFRLAELVNLYRERLKQFGTDLPDVNATRLKERLLAEIPGLVAYKKGRDILLAFEKDVGPVLSEASSDADAIILAKAAQILRRHMVNHKSKFEGKLYESSVHDSFPPALLQFVCMIEHGADIKSQLKFGATTNDLAMAQLLQYNCFAKCKEGAATQRHSRDRETPFPVYIGMSIYAKTRKRHLVEMLHDHGLSIPYNRVLDISAQLGDAVVNRYIEEGLVCPPKLRKGLFCTSAMDNIDHNPSSTTATSSFHGTSISIFQHTSSENQGEVREPIVIKNSSVKKVPELPDSYTNVHPAFFTKKKPSPPKGNVTYASLPTLLLTNEYEWLQKVSLTQDVDDEVNITWSAHHAEKKRGLAFDVSITSLFPLLRDEAHSIATVRHTKNKVRDAIAHLNPGQVPVITADQPIYSIAKQVQWHWPDLYGEDKFVVMFGGLHIEMAAFSSLGTLLQSSGWTGALVEAVVASSGTADSFLSASSVTRTRHMHQVTACCLYMLRKEAYEYHCADQNDGALNFNDWCEKCRKESPQFQFWELVLSMELVIFSLVRSFREANFNLYCQALSALIPFFFANNNVNYARWLPIHLRDMVSLEQTHPQIFSEFQLGKFVVHKTHREFSGIAIDQAHEQANAVVKGDGGAIGVTEDPSALRRWMVSGPEVSQLVIQYELASEVNEATEDIRHHEQTRQSQKSFTDKVQRLFAVMKDLGNPFQEESKDLLTLDTKNIAHPSAAELVRTHLEKGQVFQPPNWKSFLRDNENKTELFGFLAEKIVTLCPDNVVVVTKGEQALSNKPISLEGLSPCNHEEADSRIFTHALHATKQQIKSVLIKACDTDILVVAVNVFATLQDAGLEKIWIEFGQGQSIRWLPIHDMVVNLGPEKSSGMLFFHAFTGCDVVSAFRGKSKKSAWQAWEVCPEVSPVFKKLSQYPPIIEDADLKILEKFVITMYDKQSTTCKVDEARLDLFARKQRSYDAIPPTSASLVQHVKRSAFQAACIWGQATVCKMQTESPANWGWQKDGQIWQVLWTTLPPIAQTCEQLTKCGCKTECQGRCKCYRFGLKCTQLCACACEG
ncbi:hypothetical protein ROHU_004760 [Labeo rohita]|uniref:Tesmin/TSO1-like CXC domain-containing protein n=1 Tax=Labeo rohita TaxID=84645 RepID=A0A498NHX8_LABRO|nr:hypothetical protein ROHU_004760 [Labeo rohita]